MNELKSKLGFLWDRSFVPDVIPRHSKERVSFRFYKSLPEYVWDASVLEGNPFTFPQVKTLLDGITVGGHKLADQDQVLNLAASARELHRLIKTDSFRLDKSTFLALHALVAKEEALEWGVFRGEGFEKNFTPHVSLGEFGSHCPEATADGAPTLNKIFESAVDFMNKDLPPFERALAFSLFGALQQFFFDGNKRTSRLIMNGILMSHGLDSISIPARLQSEYNEKMVRFYLTKDASEMMSFLVDCHPDAEQIRRLNPNCPRFEDHKLMAQQSDSYSVQDFPEP